MKRGNCLPVTGWMFAEDLNKTKLKFHQIAQERMTRTIDAVASLRPESVFNTLCKDMRYYIGVCAGQEYRDMSLENAIAFKVKVEVEMCNGENARVIPGFDRSYDATREGLEYFGWSIEFLCWKPNFQIVTEMMNHVMSLIPDDLFETRIYGIEVPFQMISEDYATLDEDHVIENLLTELNENICKLLTVTQWFGPSHGGALVLPTGANHENL